MHLLEFKYLWELIKICVYKKKREDFLSLTYWLSQEDEAPDTGDVADGQTDGQYHPLSNTLAQPAHKQEASDHLHTAETVHDAVLQLPVAKELLGQRGHHGLGRKWRETLVQCINSFCLKDLTALTLSASSMS